MVSCPMKPRSNEIDLLIWRTQNSIKLATQRIGLEQKFVVFEYFLD